MIYLSSKIKIYMGASLVILLIIIGQLIYFYQEEPPVFIEDSIPVVEVNPDNQIISNELVVDIKGEVMNPGVYSMEENDRIGDVINKAGGATTDADMDQVNQALKVYDEMQIYIPKQGELLHEKLLDLNNGKISINQADEAELMKLAGIGPAKAKAIIDYRNKNGNFKKIEEIINVPGIGEKTYQQLKDEITIH